MKVLSLFGFCRYIHCISTGWPDRYIVWSLALNCSRERRSRDFILQYQRLALAHSFVHFQLRMVEWLRYCWTALQCTSAVAYETLPITVCKLACDRFELLHELGICSDRAVDHHIDITVYTRSKDAPCEVCNYRLHARPAHYQRYCL